MDPPVTCLMPVLFGFMQTFPEIASYTEITIRELLKLTGHLQSLDADGGWPKDQKDEIKKLVAFETWCVYGARFRNQSARTKLWELIQEVWNQEGTQFSTRTIKDALKISEKHFEIGGIRFRRRSIAGSHEDSRCLHELETRFVDTAGAVDRKVLQLLSSQDFVLAFGVYQLSNGSLTSWLENAAKVSDEVAHQSKRDADLRELVRAGVLIYAGQLRKSTGPEASSGAIHEGVLAQRAWKARLHSIAGILSAFCYYPASLGGVEASLSVPSHSRAHLAGWRPWMRQERNAAVFGIPLRPQVPHHLPDR
jgi:hypothetical protein